MKNFWIYLLVMFAVTYMVRVLPFLIFRKKIENRFVRSFLAYIPYTVLGAMTFPTVFYATGSVITASAGVIVALILAYRGKGLFEVAVFASLTAFLMSLLPF
ncbi:AzlD domain-containing protein [Roseburia sp. 499]|uniref:AzlD domain-containing protein n=1 Tax=Roseburia sp. 499 TaxID=1261634 RepID=UPI000951B682|nr:AzlD domain-containing protein [Roseburia sp. 499]WVK70952.1 AzlD domain-containing protein [Roseburia sp. 499]